MGLVLSTNGFYRNTQEKKNPEILDRTRGLGTNRNTPDYFMVMQGIDLPMYIFNIVRIFFLPTSEYRHLLLSAN